MISESKLELLFSLFKTCNSIEFLKEIFFSLRIVLIELITCEVKSKSLIIFLLILSTLGQAETINASFTDLFEIFCHISSEIKGIKGCRTLKLFSKILITESKVNLSIGC